MNLDTINEVSSQILDEANKNKGNQPSQDFIAAFNASSDLESIEERRAVRNKILQSLSSVRSASGAGFIGIWLGGIVENGANPEPHIPDLMSHFIKLIDQLSFINSDDNDELEKTPENEELDVGLKYLGQALVAHISRSNKYRTEISDDGEIMALFDKYSFFSVGVTWVLELLTKHSNELLVIHVEKKIGVHVRYENISNCFHLFTLFQECIVDIVPHEQSDESHHDNFSKVAWWHYGQASSPEACIISSVFGEMSPKGISVISGIQVMLLWSKILESRSWDDGFFHPLLDAAPASINLISVLSNEEVKGWFKKLNLENKK